MKQLTTVLSLALFTAALLAGCSEEAATPSAQPSTPVAQMGAAPEASAPGKIGKVTETMDAAGYTYIRVETATETFWAAAPQFAVKAGDDVVVPEGMPMPDYHSKSLDRTFDMVYFVPAVLVGGAQAAAGGVMPEGHPPMTGGKTAAVTTDIDLTGIKVAAGGQTVGDVFAKKTALAGKPVTVRGKVVKFSPEIMGKNWLHIQDGTGGEGTNDLTVTTAGVAKLGDTVLISGVLIADKDFGYGYKYDVIVEDAAVTVE